MDMVLIMLAVVITKQVSAEIVFSVLPASKAIVFGNDLTLDCDAKDTTDPTKKLSFYWFFNSVSSPPGSSIFTNHSLLVQDLSQEHIGNYTCGVMSEDLKSVLALSAPAVVIHAFIRTFLTNPASLSVTEGEVVELECVTGESAPAPIVIWEKNGKQFFEGDQYTSVFGMSTIPGVISQYAMKLVIQTASYDTGAYNCVARNPALGVEVRSLKVDLQVEALERAPYVDSSLYLQNVIAPRDQPLQIICPIRGYPIPHITWEFNGAPFVSTDYTILFPNGSIFIVNLEEKNDGPYVCEGVNYLGSVKSAMINVRTAFIELEFVSEPYRVFTIAGQSQTLPCSPPRSYPLATVTWYKNNKLVVYRTGQQALFIVDPANNVWDLFFAEVQKPDEGEYFCVASNNYSVPTARTSSTAVMSVGGAPIFLQPPIGVTAIKGEGVALTCLVGGDPFPEIRWLQDRIDVVPNSQVTFTRNYQEIHIADINKAYEGTYTCRASNSYGIRETDAYVRVLVPVVIVNPVANITAKAGSEVKVTCGVYGDPKPTVVWYRDSTILTPSGRFSPVDDGLIIHDVKIADAGMYGCQATNEAGEASSQAELVVLATPFFLQIPEDQVVLAGQGFNLTCEVDGNPKPSVDWLFNSTNLFPPGIFVSLDKRHLQVTDTSWLHVGKYTCVAASMEGAISSTAIIALHVPPRVYRIVGNAIVYVTNDLELTCLVDGVPAPAINWRHDGQQLGPSFDGRVSYPERHRLLVKVAGSSDAGEYKCIADNLAGRSELTIDVFVIEPPIPPQLMDPSPVSSSAIQVTWKPVTQKTHTIVSQYVLYYKEKLDLDYSRHPAIILGTETVFLVQYLTPGAEYFFTMSAVNTAGEGARSNVKIAKTFDSGPSAPRNLHVKDIGPSQVELMWEIPAQTNGEIRKYRIWYRPRNGGLSPKTVEFFINGLVVAPTYTVMNLDPYTDHEFSVQGATIENGLELWGNLSTTIDTRTGVTAPSGSPVDLMVIAQSPYVVQVTWNPVPLPLQHGPITKYHVRYRPAATFTFLSDIVVNNGSLKVNVTGLLPWSWYSFLVVAENAGGLGPPSSEIVVRTKQAAPSGKPVNLVVEAISMDTIKVMFSLPDPATWNSELTGFLVEYGKHGDSQDKSETINTYNLDSLSLNISNLASWTRYEVRVALISGPFNTLQGPFTDWILVKTKEAVAGTVRNIRFTTTPTSITLNWDPPSELNGVIQGYFVDFYILSSEGGTGVTRVEENGEENTTAENKISVNNDGTEQAVVRRSTDLERSKVISSRVLPEFNLGQSPNEDSTEIDTHLVPLKHSNSFLTEMKPSVLLKEDVPYSFTSGIEQKGKKLDEGDVISEVVQILNMDGRVYMKMANRNIGKAETLSSKLPHDLVKRNADQSTESDPPDWVLNADHDKLKTTCSVLINTNPSALQLLDTILLNMSKASDHNQDDEATALLSDILDAWSARLDDDQLVLNTSTGLMSLQKDVHTWLLQGNVSIWSLCYKLWDEGGATSVISMTTTTEEAVLLDLVPSSTYSITVSAYGDAGKGANRSINVTTDKLPPPPPPPSTPAPTTPTPAPLSTPVALQTSGVDNSNEFLAAVIGGSLAGVFLVTMVLVLGVCLCLRWRTVAGTVVRNKTPDPIILDNDSRASSSRSGSGTSSVTEENGQFGQVDINIGDVRFDVASTSRSRSVPEGYGSLKGASNMTLQLPSLARSAHSVTGVQNPMFMGDHNHHGYQEEDQESMAVSMALSAEEVYSQASNTLKRKNRMRSESAAAIAVMRTSAIPDIGTHHGNDTDNLIKNDSVVVYTERTAL
ncbi:Down syndrome cell adhesion molecule homolog [Mizuhopecten yessoensis]|uniref:Contactin-5 n=1 Tax=Mizuhopecten yessoensis TaxID=6573 RepID=A0A210QKU0_MIZYE|nr:Down syndrome cell adhesion molecule homolog [Mizuhopecten yessoensis]OWF49359.1 Contactin-5 [Mizuhopecten yessoensis]